MMGPMRILGIDPGLRTTGFGVIESEGAALHYVASGTIRTDAVDTGQLPARLKIKRWTTKYLLKRALAGRLPDAILERRKQGFGVPVHEWFLARLGGVARREIDELCRRTDLFERREALRLIDERRGTEAWLLLNLALWWKHYIEGLSVEELAA